MIDYKTFKKGYLTEWVDRSQAARKAAEELAMKEVKPSLRDKYAYKSINSDLVFTLDGHKVEFKGKNEKKSNGSPYFTWTDAVKRFGEPDKDGWRLPTEKEMFSLITEYDRFFDKNNKCGVVDNRLKLPANGYFDFTHKVAIGKERCCFYWTSDTKSENSGTAANLAITELMCEVGIDRRGTGFCVRLVREIQ